MNEIKDFVLVEAENLSMNDEFMKFEPQTAREEQTKYLIIDAINNETKNFYRPKYDPSFTDNGKGICFVPGKKPAVGKSYPWWRKIAHNFYPERNSRLGTKLEYGAFLGVLIKKLVEEGNSVKWAWNAVCNDSKELGHYWNSEDGKHELEATGSRCVCGFCDLANSYKVLERDSYSQCIQLVGGSCNKFSFNSPLAFYKYFNSRSVVFGYGVGWIVLEE